MKILNFLFSKTGMWFLIPALICIIALLLQGNVYGMRFLLQLTALGSGVFLLFVTSVFLRKTEGVPKYVGNGIFWTIIAVIVFLFVLFIVVEGLIFYHQNGDDPIPESVNAVFILGCQVEGETPCEMLEMRLEAAYEFLAARPDSVAVLCGGQGQGELITEAECMRRWLVARGISDDRLIPEGSSESTLENIQNGKEILLQRFPDTEEIAVATTGFHLYRAKHICNTAGLSAYGLSGEIPDSSVVILNSYLREFAGVFFMYVREIFA